MVRVFDGTNKVIIIQIHLLVIISYLTYSCKTIFFACGTLVPFCQPLVGLFAGNLPKPVASSNL